MMRRKRVTRSILVGLAFLGLAPAVAQPEAETTPPILEAETSGVLPLPPAGPHRVIVASGNGFKIVNGDTAKMEGSVHGGWPAVLAVAPDNSRFYVSETYWSRGNRGQRSDLVSVYDGTTLKLLNEIAVPGRLLIDGRSPYFGISANGKRGYVFNLEPASSVQVVDLQKNKFVGNIEIPGCGLIYPYRDEGFASLCADGSLATVTVNAAGKGTLKQTAPFFTAETDPVFEESLIDRTTGEGFFITYTGQVHPVTLGAEPSFGKVWSLQSAAGLSDATPDVTLKTWRPGGRRPFAYHRASKMLYVLMHEGKHWTQKVEGTEVWAIDTAEQRVKGRFKLPTAGRVIGVSQDAAPQLYVAGEGDWLWIIDPANGKILRQMDEIERVGMIQVMGF
jgi:methylamine dehydrogenase heavy chain